MNTEAFAAIQELRARQEREKEDRAARLPDTKTCLHHRWEVHVRLKELGWKDIAEAPQDGTIFNAIDGGNAGPYDCRYVDDWRGGYWHACDPREVWASHPILFKLKEVPAK